MISLWKGGEEREREREVNRIKQEVTTSELTFQHYPEAWLEARRCESWLTEHLQTWLLELPTVQRERKCRQWAWGTDVVHYEE